MHGYVCAFVCMLCLYEINKRDICLRAGFSYSRIDIDIYMNWITSVTFRQTALCDGLLLPTTQRAQDKLKADVFTDKNVTVYNHECNKNTYQL